MYMFLCGTLHIDGYRSRTLRIAEDERICLRAAVDEDTLEWVVN